MFRQRPLTGTGSCSIPVLVPHAIPPKCRNQIVSQEQSSRCHDNFRGYIRRTPSRYPRDILLTRRCRVGRPVLRMQRHLLFGSSADDGERMWESWPSDPPMLGQVFASAITAWRYYRSRSGLLGDRPQYQAVDSSCRILFIPMSILGPVFGG
jgi:hypothetical protein